MLFTSDRISPSMPDAEAELQQRSQTVKTVQRVSTGLVRRHHTEAQEGKGA